MAVLIAVSGNPAAPLTYTVPGSTAFVCRTASCAFDGTGAGGSFLPVMRWIAQDGSVIGSYVAPVVAAGASAAVSWFPRVNPSSGSTPTTSAVTRFAYLEPHGGTATLVAGNATTAIGGRAGALYTNTPTVFSEGSTVIGGVSCTGVVFNQIGHYKIEASLIPTTVPASGTRFQFQEVQSSAADASPVTAPVQLIMSATADTGLAFLNFGALQTVNGIGVVPPTAPLILGVRNFSAGTFRAAVAVYVEYLDSDPTVLL